MKYLLLFMGIIFCVCCNTNHKDQTAFQVIEVDINSLSAKSFEEFYKLKKVIPLETVEGSYMGQLDKIILADDKLFVKGQKDNMLVVFDTTGKYLYTFNKQGKGPEEYLEIKDFGIDKNKNELIIYSRQGYAYYYNIDGDFLRNEERDQLISNFEILPNGGWFTNHALLHYSAINDVRYILRVSDKEGNYIQGCSPFPDLNYYLPVNVPSPLFVNKDQYWGIPITENTIYEYDVQNTLFIPHYHYIIKNFPVPDASQLRPEDLINQFIFDYYMFFSPYIGEKTILFTAFCGKAKEKKMLNIVTDKSTNKVEILDKLIDKENDLELTRFFQHSGFGDEVLTYILPLHLLEYEPKNENSLSYRLQQQIGEEDNPILFIYEER